MKLFVLNIKGRGGWCLKIEKRGDVYELNIVNVVVVECDVIYVSILYHLCRICKAGQFAGIYSPLPPMESLYLAGLVVVVVDLEDFFIILFLFKYYYFLFLFIMY